MVDAPTLTLVDPPEGKVYYVDYTAPAAVHVDITMQINGFTLGPANGMVICHVNGGGPSLTATSGLLKGVDLGTAKGVRVISCTLALPTTGKLQGPEATANLHLYIAQDPTKLDDANTCKTDSDCVDPMPCSVGKCGNGKCSYLYAQKDPACCSTSYECPAGRVCIGSGLAASCSLCQVDSQCDDQDPCTFDKCTPGTGLCAFVAGGDPLCCKVSADCNDYDPLTEDWCDGNHQCKYKAASDASATDSSESPDALDAASPGDSLATPDDLAAQDVAIAETAGDGASAGAADASAPDASAADTSSADAAVTPDLPDASAAPDAPAASPDQSDAGLCDSPDGCGLGEVDTCTGDAQVCHPNGTSSPSGPADNGCSAVTFGAHSSAEKWLLLVVAGLAAARRRRGGASPA